MSWLAAAVATLGGVMLGLALRAWSRGEAPPLLAARGMGAGAGFALAWHLAGGPTWGGMLGALLLLGAVALRAGIRTP